MLLTAGRTIASPAAPFAAAGALVLAAFLTSAEWLLWGSVGVLAGFSLSGSV